MYVPLIAVPACPTDLFVVRDVLTITRPGFNKRRSGCRCGKLALASVKRLRQTFQCESGCVLDHDQKKIPLGTGVRCYFETRSISQAGMSQFYKSL